MADTAQLTLTAVSNQAGGVYTFPYEFTVNGTTNVPLMCDTFQNEISVGQSWTANVFPLLSAGSNGLFSSLQNSQTLYDEAGLILQGVLGQGPLASYSGLNPGLGNWAVWNLLDPGDTSGNPYGSVLTDLENAAFADAHDTSGLGNVVIYTPVNGTIGNSPQELIGLVPEPCTLALMSIGLFICGSIMRRRRRQLR